MKSTAIVLSLVFVLYAITGFWVVPQFENIFISFDPDLPPPTRFMLETYRYWLVLALFPIGAYKLLKNNKKYLTVIMYVLMVFAVLFIPLMIALMYLPIFKLGAVTV